VTRRDAGGVAALAVGVILVPLVTTSQYQLSVGVFAGIHAIVTLGLCLLVGYAGQISLGHAAFYGLGAYVSGVLTTRGVNAWVAMVAAVLLTAAVAHVLGRPILRLHGHHLAMATLAFGVIVYLAFVELTDLTGGPSGLAGVPRLAVGGWAVDSDRKAFYLTWGIALAALVAALNIVNSRIGRALRAVRGSEVGAETLGIDASALKLQVFGLSAAYAALAGSLYAHYMRFVSPPPFGFIASVEFLVMAAVGGLASVWGAPFGAAAVTLLAEGIRNLMPRLLAHASGEHEVIAYGLLLIVVMVLVPEGLTAGGVRWARRLARATPG
jgi:branched-chain amino acid transport system permease protein